MSQDSTEGNQIQVGATHTESDNTQPDETAAGPAERHDEGNDNPATTAPVE